MTGPVVVGESCDELLELWQERFGAPPFGGHHSHAFYAINFSLILSGTSPG